MALSFEPFVALRYLRSKRKEVFISIITVISILGVAVSVMVLNIVLAVMTGFEKELQAKLLDTTAHVVVRQYGGLMTNWEDVRDRIKAVQGVVAIEPYTYNQAMISTDAGSQGILLRGIANVPEVRTKLSKYLKDPSHFDELFNPEPTVVERPDGSRDNVILPPLLLGRALEGRLGLYSGSLVTVLTPQLSSSPQGLLPKMKRFRVVGSYHSGLVEYESGLAYTSIDAAQRLFSLGNAVTGLEVAVHDANDAIRIAGLIRDTLGGFEAPFEVTDWTVPNKPLWDALRLEKRVYFIVLLLLTLIASFSIVSTLVMIVMEKGKDIAILKTIGASDRSILHIFLMQGAIIGFLGTVLGTALGYLGAIGLQKFGFPLDQAVFSLDTVPVHIVGLNFLLVAVCAFLITSLAGIYPARRAARLQPADALRFE